jgi:hypothetical protein
MDDQKLADLEREYNSRLDKIERKHIEAVAWYDAATDRIFADPATARKNLDAIEQRIGTDAAMTLVERGFYFDYETRTRLNRKFAIGETRAANESERQLVEASVYEVREAWLDVQYHAREYDKVSRALSLVREERARGVASAQRAKSQGEREREHDRPRHRARNPINDPVSTAKKH